MNTISSLLYFIGNKIKSPFPVGSIYMSVNNVNPSQYFGGTWVAWGSGRVPVGVNASETEFNTAEKTGGAKTHSHTNPDTNNTSLTVANLPKHTHSYAQWTMRSSVAGSGGTHVQELGAPASQTTGETGSGTGHKHSQGATGSSSTLQPYIVCYMWKRTN